MSALWGIPRCWCCFTFKGLLTAPRIGREDVDNGLARRDARLTA